MFLKTIEDGRQNSIEAIITEMIFLGTLTMSDG